MIAACQKRKKIPGLLVQDIASAKEWIRKGVRLLPFSNEVSMLMDTSANAVKEIRAEQVYTAFHNKVPKQ